MGKIVDGELKGKVTSKSFGGVVTYGKKGDMRVRGLQSRTRPMTNNELYAAIRFVNVMAMYNKLAWLVRMAWDERLAPRNESGYVKGWPRTWFTSANLEKRGCALWPRYDDVSGCVAVPYQVTNGLLEPIRVVPIDKDGNAERRSIEDCPRARTNLRIGELVVDENVTVGDMADAIIRNNADWEWGDTLVYVSLEQTAKEEHFDFEETRLYPFVKERHWIVGLEASNQPLNEVMDLRWVQNVNGYIGQGEESPKGGYCWIHLRGLRDESEQGKEAMAMSDEEVRERYAELALLEEEDEYLLPEVPNMQTKHKRKKKITVQKVESSRQDLVCNNKELIAYFRDSEQVTRIMERHRKCAGKKRTRQKVGDSKEWKTEDWSM